MKIFTGRWDKGIDKRESLLTELVACEELLIDRKCGPYNFTFGLSVANGVSTKGKIVILVGYNKVDRKRWFTEDGSRVQFLSIKNREGIKFPKDAWPVGEMHIIDANNAVHIDFHVKGNPAIISYMGELISRLVHEGMEDWTS